MEEIALGVLPRGEEHEDDSNVSEQTNDESDQGDLLRGEQHKNESDMSKKTGDRLGTLFKVAADAASPKDISVD